MILSPLDQALLDAARARQFNGCVIARSSPAGRYFIAAVCLDLASAHAAAEDFRSRNAIHKGVAEVLVKSTRQL